MNFSAALEGASQGLDQLASLQAQKEMQQATAMRAENLAQLRNYLTTRRELIVTGERTQALEDRDTKRIAAEHANRDEEIDRQESGRERNQAAAQHQQLINTEHAQDNAFTNQAELQARGQGRAARVQAARSAAVQANQARADKAQIREWLGKYQQQSHGPGTVAGDPLDAQRLFQLAQHDPVLKSQLQAYKDADAREQAATRAMGKFPSPYDTPSTSGAVAPANDSLASPPTSMLIPYSDDEGPGVSNQPYPSPSGADKIDLSGSTSEGGTGGSGSSRRR